MAMNYNRKWESFIRGRGEEYEEIFHDPEEDDMDMDMAMAKSSEEVASMEESSLKASGKHEMAIFGAESYFGSYNRHTTEDQHGLSLHQFQAGCSSNTAIMSSGSSTTSIRNSATCSRMSISSSSCSNLCSSISNSTDSSGFTSRSISSNSSMSSSNSSCSNSSSINRTIINGSSSTTTSSTISNSGTSQRSSTNSSSGSEGMEEMRISASKKPCNAQSRLQSSTFLSFFARFNLIHSSHRHQNTANTTSPQPQQIQTKPAYHCYTNVQMLPPIGKPPTISSHTRRTSSSSSSSSSCHPNRSSSSSSHPNRSSSSSSLSSSSSHPNRANPAHYTNRTSSSALISDPGSTTNHKYYSCNSKDQKMKNKREYFERDMHTPPSYVENSSEKSIEDYTSSLYYHSLDLNYKAILSNPSSSSSLSPSPSSYSITGANSTTNTNDHKMSNKGEYERDLYTPQSCYGNSSQMAIIEDSTPSLYYHPLHLSKYILSDSSSSLSSSSSKQKAFSYCERPSHLPPITQLKYTTRKRQIVHLPLEVKEEEKDGDDGVKKVGGGFIHKHVKSFGLYDLDVSSEGAKSKREEQLGYESDSSSDLFELQVHDQNMDLQKNRTSHI